MRKASVFVLFLYVLVIQCKEEEDNDVFVATKQWQTVRKGQKIPKGLHVRINLETGLTEAKLLDESEDKSKALVATERGDDEEVMKNIKSDVTHMKNIDKFRTYDELKQSLEELNLTAKIDAELIADLLKKHDKAASSEKVVTILEDLDFLAHQYDNAREFLNQDGLKRIIYKNLNKTDVHVIKGTLKLMSSLMQNNVEPKIRALETDALRILVRLVDNHSDVGVKRSAVAALGALLRSFPVAQHKFVESGGLSVLSKFFDLDDIKLQIRIVTMISDLMVERRFATQDDGLRRFYNNFDLIGPVLEQDWCAKLNKLLLGLIITDKDDHDSFDKCLTAMHSLREYCSGEFDQHLLSNLLKRYSALSLKDSEDSESIFGVLEQLCDEILHEVNQSRVKTEL